jgi:hypothetical protein
MVGPKEKQSGNRRESDKLRVTVKVAELGFAFCFHLW